VLGRGVVVAGGCEAPPPWRDAPRVVVDDGALAEPSSVADALHRHWLDRRPVVVELAVRAEELRAPEIDRREPAPLADVQTLAARHAESALRHRDESLSVRDRARARSEHAELGTRIKSRVR